MHYPSEAGDSIYLSIYAYRFINNNVVVAQSVHTMSRKAKMQKVDLKYYYFDEGIQPTILMCMYRLYILYNEVRDDDDDDDDNSCTASMHEHMKSIMRTLFTLASNGSPNDAAKISKIVRLVWQSYTTYTTDTQEKMLDIFFLQRLLPEHETALFDCIMTCGIIDAQSITSLKGIGINVVPTLYHCTDAATLAIGNGCVVCNHIATRFHAGTLHILTAGNVPSLASTLKTLQTPDDQFFATRYYKMFAAKAVQILNLYNFFVIPAFNSKVEQDRKDFHERMLGIMYSDDDPRCQITYNQLVNKITAFKIPADERKLSDYTSNTDAITHIYNAILGESIGSLDKDCADIKLRRAIYTYCNEPVTPVQLISFVVAEHSDISFISEKLDPAAKSLTKFSSTLDTKCVNIDFKDIKVIPGNQTYLISTTSVDQPAQSDTARRIYIADLFHTLKEKSISTPSTIDTIKPHTYFDYIPVCTFKDFKDHVNTFVKDVLPICPIPHGPQNNRIVALYGTSAIIDNRPENHQAQFFMISNGGTLFKGINTSFSFIEWYRIEAGLCIDIDTLTTAVENTNHILLKTENEFCYFQKPELKNIHIYINPNDGLITLRRSTTTYVTNSFVGISHIKLTMDSIYMLAVDSKPGLVWRVHYASIQAHITNMFARKNPPALTPEKQADLTEKIHKRLGLEYQTAASPTNSGPIPTTQRRQVQQVQPTISDKNTLIDVFKATQNTFALLETYAAGQ